MALLGFRSGSSGSNQEIQTNPDGSVVRYPNGWVPWQPWNSWQEVVSQDPLLRYRDTLPGHVRCIGDGPSGAFVFTCEDYVGCCGNECCYKDRYWLNGLYVLIAFVILFAIAGAVAVIICMQRMKSNKVHRIQENGYSSNASVAQYPPIGYAPSVISQGPGSTGYIYEPLSGRKY